MSERTTKEQTAVLLGTAVPGDSGNKSTPDSMRCQRHGKIGCGGCWLDALQGQTVTGWLRKMQAEIRAEGHAGWGNTLDDAIAFIERLTSPVPAEQPKPSPCVEPSGSTGPADAQKIVDAVLRFVDYDTDGHWWCDVAKARGAVKKLLAGPADAGSHETLQQRAEDLWEEVGGGLCICTISTVGHWCEKCQQRIALIKDALRAASASAPAAPREVGGAAPTSTPLKHGPDCPLSQMIGSINSEGEIEVSSWPESACSCVPTSTPLDALRERLQFVAPPGPPDPPPSHASVTHCPNGHRLLWTSNRQAICDAQGTALCVAWELTVGNDGRRRLTEVVNPTARSFAYSLQKLLAASPASALVAPRKEKET
jgi:hypothetical protein